LRSRGGRSIAARSSGEADSSALISSRVRPARCPVLITASVRTASGPYARRPLTRAAGGSKPITQAMTGRAVTADGLRVYFRPEAGDELHALVAVETECCPWATWRIERDAGLAVLDVRSAAEGVAALHGMFTAGPAGQSPGHRPASSPGRGHRDTRR
jgi:hypothetical protein